MRKPRIDAPYPKPTNLTYPYAHFPHKVVRPYCELCGPFRSEFLRRLENDNYGPRYRCHKCESED